jgi:hypothetical protein
MLPQAPMQRNDPAGALGTRALRLTSIAQTLQIAHPIAYPLG